MMAWLTSLFAGLSFANPLALAALLILPIIYWLLRFTPPAPQSVRFPPFRLLLGLISKEEESDHTPWWLIALRLSLAAAIILAIAGPTIANNKTAALSNKPLLLLVDNDWSSANYWPAHKQVLTQTIAAAGAKGIPVALSTSTPNKNPLPQKFNNARTASNLANAIAPQSIEVDRAKQISKLNKLYGDSKALQIIWLSNGRADNGSFIAGLKKLASGNASLKIHSPSPNQLPLILDAPKRQNDKIIITVHRATPSKNSNQNPTINLAARDGRSLASKSLIFPPGKTTAKLEITLPLALRNQASRIEISGQTHAGAIHLLDDRWRRKTVGIVSGERRALSQPLLSPLYYVTRALSPVAHIIHQNDDTSTAKLLKSGISMLVMADIGIIAPKNRTALEKWLTNGGVLVRFAGPRLADAKGVRNNTINDPLIPVQLRQGGRALGSALSWQEPQTLAPFAQGTPLEGLKLNKDVKITRQILAEPTPELAGRVWASLEDGTPLITAKSHGRGLVVLIHVTANPDWSDLPLSGLFVDILTRILDLSPAVTSTAQANASFSTNTISQSYTPQSSLDGFGHLVPPSADAKPIQFSKIKTVKTGLQHPAGFYKRAANLFALNLKIDPKHLTPLKTKENLLSYQPAPALALASTFLIIAFVLALLDSIAALFLMGGFERLKQTKTPLLIFTIVLTAATYTPSQLNAQTATQKGTSEKDAMEAVSQTRLAYVKTGNEVVDLTSLAGLNGLNLALSQRTSIEPGFPQGIDLETDDIVFYPLLYWPIVENTKPPSDRVVAKLQKFMKNGGTIFFDTRDESASMQSLFGNPSAKTLTLRRVLQKFDIPALEPVPARHVLTRAFYLMQHFPGRWLGGKLWVESSSTDKSQIDGVTSIIIGSNDYAAAWAIGGDQKPLFATIPGAPRQREFAYRTGINIVMYTLTGNYKADQVHVPALLRRLGQ